MSEVQAPSTATLRRAAFASSVGIFISRISGLLREMAFGYFFGASQYFDAFVIAFRIPNTLRVLIGEGAFTVAMLPHLADARARSEQAESQFIAAVFVRWTLALTLISALLMLVTPWLTRGYAPGMSAEIFDLTVTTGQWMAWYVLPVGLYGLTQAVAQVRKRFFWVSVAPLAMNMAQVGAVVWAVLAVASPRAGVWALVVSVWVGGALQLLISMVPMREKPRADWARWRAHPEAFWGILRTAAPASVGLGVYQLQVMITTALATLVGPGTVSKFFYVDRLVQLPLAMLGTSVGMVALPFLADLAAHRDQVQNLHARAGNVLDQSMAMAWALLLPCVLALTLGADIVVWLVYGHGAFARQGAEAALDTARILALSSWGLPAAVSVRILNSYFYAQKDTRVPMFLAVSSLSALAVLGWPLAEQFGSFGLACALAASSWMQLLVAVSILARRGFLVHMTVLRHLVVPMGLTVVVGSSGRLLGMPALPMLQQIVLAAAMMLAYLSLLWWMPGPLGGQGALGQLAARLRRRAA